MLGICEAEGAVQPVDRGGILVQPSVGKSLSLPMSIFARGLEIQYRSVQCARLTSSSILDSAVWYITPKCCAQF